MKHTLKKISLAILPFAIAFVPSIQAQTAASAVASPFGLTPLYNATDQIAFNAAYKASLPPTLAAYMALPYNAFTAGSATVPTRTTPAVLLQAASQFTLDTQIAVRGQDDP